MTEYKIIQVPDFLSEHTEYINNFIKAIKLLSEHSDDIVGLKDVNSVHIACSRHYSKIVGLAQAEDASGRTDFDMPCTGTSQYASQYIEEDKTLINNKKIDIVTSILNVHNYSDGLKARVFKKDC